MEVEEAVDVNGSEEVDEVDEAFEVETGEVTCNLQNVYDSLKIGLVGDDDVDLSCYLSAYNELYNFFYLLGGAFSFVSSDVKSKIKILNDLRSSEMEKTKTISNFSTVKKMIVYEKEGKLLENKKYISGSRTLLRLHRGLDFIRKFLLELSKLGNDVKVGGVCRETYDKTLANFHGFAIRKAAGLAMRFLPTKLELFKKITKNDPEEMALVTKLLPEMLEFMKVAYDRVEALYTLFDLHNLP